LKLDFDSVVLLICCTEVKTFDMEGLENDSIRYWWFI